MLRIFGNRHRVDHHKTFRGGKAVNSWLDTLVWGYNFNQCWLPKRCWDTQSPKNISTKMTAVLCRKCLCDDHLAAKKMSDLESWGRGGHRCNCCLLWPCNTLSIAELLGIRDLHHVFCRSLIIAQFSYVFVISELFLFKKYYSKFFSKMLCKRECDNPFIIHPILHGICIVLHLILYWICETS